MNLILPDLTLFSRETTAWNLIGGLKNLKKKLQLQVDGWSLLSVTFNAGQSDSFTSGCRWGLTKISQCLLGMLSF